MSLKATEQDTRFKIMSGQLLRGARQDAGMTATAVARELGTSLSQVSRWEGGIQLPRIDSLAMLGRLYGVSIAVLVPPAEVLDQLRNGGPNDGNGHETEGAPQGA